MRRLLGDSVNRQEYTELLSLLRGFVHEEVPSFPEEPDWRKLFSLAQIHGLTGILSWMIAEYGLTEDTELLSYAKKITRETVVMYVRRGDNARRLLEGLNAQGIDHLLFKGYLVRNCYPVPELRSYGDIDLAIRPDDRKRVHNWMLEQGFETGTDWEPVYSYHRGMELYEFHTDIMEVNVTDRADYRSYFRSVWNHAECRDGHTFFPECSYHFLYLLAHIAKHIGASGAGLRMYLDLAFFIKQYGKNMEWEWIQSQLEQIRLTEFASTAMSAVEEWFGVSCPLNTRPIHADVLSEFLEFTMEGGIFGHQKRDSGVIALKREDRYDMHSISRLTVLLHRLFPDAATIERRYTYLNGRHWLLPVAWVHRFFRTRETWGDHAREARTILTADEKEVLRLKKIYSEIGLG